MSHCRSKKKYSEGKKEDAEPLTEALNQPVRQSLLPLLVDQGTHPSFAERGLSAKTCQYLGCGFLPADHKSSLRGRIVFQVRSLDDLEAVQPKPTVLTHIGRATTEEQTSEVGKWTYYKGFRKSLELYNVDQLRLDPDAVFQVQATGKILLVEGCFDVAKCVEAGIKNVVASFGTNLSQTQIDKLHLLKEVMNAQEIIIWFDRDKAGSQAQENQVDALKADGLPATGFDWNQKFQSDVRGSVAIPDTIQDPCDLWVRQIQWLREAKII